MIARLVVHVPFFMAIPENEVFPLYEFEHKEYRVRFRPPGRTDLADRNDPPDKVTIDGKPAYIADAIVIDFIKDLFDRGEHSSMDPPENVIKDVIEMWLARLRYVCRAPQVRSPNFPLCTWQLRYLDDASGELTAEKGYVRGLGGRSFSFAFIAIEQQIWKTVHENADLDETPVWETVRLDALAALPHVGTAIVLGAVALEVFIAGTLDRLAASKLSPELWAWINDRGDHAKEPSVEEQFDAMLKEFTGNSLKSQRLLWESFMKLKTARNSFVHRGVPKAYGKTIDSREASKLLNDVSEIISVVGSWMPAELQWPEFRFNVKVEALKSLLEARGENQA